MTESHHNYGNEHPNTENGNIQVALSAPVNQLFLTQSSRNLNEHDHL